MERLMLQGRVLGYATGNIAGHRLGRIVITHPLHMQPGFLAPDEIVHPEKRLDIEWPERYGNLF